MLVFIALMLSHYGPICSQGNQVPSSLFIGPLFMINKC